MELRKSIAPSNKDRRILSQIIFLVIFKTRLQSLPHLVKGNWRLDFTRGSAHMYVGYRGNHFSCYYIAYDIDE